MRRAFLISCQQRKSLKHCPENWISEELVQNFKAYADIALKTNDWNRLLQIYKDPDITDEKAYYKLKEMANEIFSIKEEYHNKKTFRTEINCIISF